MIELEREAFDETMLGVNSAQQPVLVIPLNADNQLLLTIPEAREFAEEILRSCRKADRGFAGNDR